MSSNNSNSIRHPNHADRSEVRVRLGSHLICSGFGFRKKIAIGNAKLIESKWPKWICYLPELWLGNAYEWQQILLRPNLSKNEMENRLLKSVEKSVFKRGEIETTQKIGSATLTLKRHWAKKVTRVCEQESKRETERRSQQRHSWQERQIKISYRKSRDKALKIAAIIGDIDWVRKSSSWNDFFVTIFALYTTMFAYTWVSLKLQLTPHNIFET